MKNTELQPDPRDDPEERMFWTLYLIEQDLKFLGKDLEKYIEKMKRARQSERL